MKLIYFDAGNLLKKKELEQLAKSAGYDFVPVAAMQIMHGGRRELLALLGWYALQMLPLVTIPWVLPKAVLSVTVFCNLRCRLWRDAIANGTYRSLPRYVPSDK